MRSVVRPVLALLVLCVALPATAAPQLLASIRPLQLIAIAVVGEPARVDLLIEPRQSHHDYQLRPSDRLRLQQAGLVLWIGPSLEGFLRQPLAAVEEERVLMLGADELDMGHHATDDDHHAHADAHLWLDPEQAIAMAQAIADRMSELEPAQQKRWQHNVVLFTEQMRRVDAALKTELAALPARRGYLVPHDAYGHFERHYGLERTATWAVTPEQLPGARHLLALQKQIEAGEVGCVFTEPLFEPRALQAMLADTSIHTRQLDLMAEAAPLTAEGFVLFFEQFGEAVVDCLRP